tara:strand:+ start:1861 stop:2793 length:933 start_codon:yes stop_codon:yes gene_type:complete
MIEKEPIHRLSLFGLDEYFNELANLFHLDKLPSKVLLSGQKGLGKSTLVHHFINYILSKEEEYSYDRVNFKINSKNQSFITMSNKSNINFSLIDVNSENKSIDINQIRELILRLNKSSFNNKPRFILIDNIEFLNVNSVNALLKILEEPSSNIYFFLINNNKKVLPTLLSRCINFKISLNNNDIREITNRLLDDDVKNLVNEDLINYYCTPGNIIKLIQFSNDNNYDLKNMNLKEFLKIIIKNNHYKKDISIKYLIFELVEYYFSKIESSLSFNFNDRYNYFLKKIADTKKFNLDEESLFMEFEDKILNE